MPRVKFSVEFEDATGKTVIGVSDIPAQTKKEAIEKGFSYLNTLTPTAKMQTTFAEKLTAAIESIKANEDAGPLNGVSTAAKSKRTSKK